MTDPVEISDPASTTWSTRADLLDARAAAVERLERAYSSMRALSGVAAATALATLGLFLAGYGFNEALVENNDTGANLVLAILGLIAAVAWPPRPLLHRLREGRSLAASLSRWRDADATVAARDLPEGDITADLRTLWDARRQEDFESVALRDIGAAQAQLTAGSVILRAVLGGVGLGLAIALGIASGTSFDQPLFALGSGLACLVMLISAGRAAIGATRDGYRAQQRTARLADERTILIGERALTGLAQQAGATPKVSLAARLAGGLVVAAIIAFVIIRLASAEPVAIVIVVAVVALAVVMLVGVAMRRRAAERAAVARVPNAEAGATIGGQVRLTSFGLTIDPVPLGAVEFGADQLSVHGPSATSIPLADVVGAGQTDRHAVTGLRTIALYVSDGSTLLLTTTAGAKVVQFLRRAEVKLVPS